MDVPHNVESQLPVVIIEMRITVPIFLANSKQKANQTLVAAEVGLKSKCSKMGGAI